MKAFKLCMVVWMAILICEPVFGREVKVGFEPLPPLIVDKDTGYTIDMLKAIEKISDFKFTIKIMPYNRAKHMLKTGGVDLAGHTPYRLVRFK